MRNFPDSLTFVKDAIGDGSVNETVTLDTDGVDKVNVESETFAGTFPEPFTVLRALLGAEVGVEELGRVVMLMTEAPYGEDVTLFDGL